MTSHEPEQGAEREELNGKIGRTGREQSEHQIRTEADNGGSISLGIVALLERLTVQLLGSSKKELPVRSGGCSEWMSFLFAF